MGTAVTMADSQRIPVGTKPSNFRNKTGMRFGRLVVLRQAEARYRGGGAWWLCRCDCGNEVTVRGDRLAAGITKSCRECARRRSNKNLNHIRKE